MVNKNKSDYGYGLLIIKVINITNSAVTNLGLRFIIYFPALIHTLLYSVLLIIVKVSSFLLASKQQVSN